MVLCNSPAEKGKYEQARENNIKEFNTQYQALFGKPVVQMKTCTNVRASTSNKQQARQNV